MASRWLLILGCLFACSRAPISRPQQLNLAFLTDPISFDPRKGGDFISATLHCMLYEGLTRCGPDGSIEMALAERVEIENGEKTYLFYLRPTTWSDGKPVTAHDFEKTWKEVLDPNFPSLCSYLLFVVQNGENFAKSKATANEVGIRALDERTLRVDLEKPTPYFLSLTAFPLLMPVPSHAERVTNGPFVLQSYLAQKEIVLQKNPNYWNSQTVSLDTIHISILPHETTAWQLFERGELDWIGGAICPLSPDILEHVRPRLEFHEVAATTFCTFNTQVPPFDNPDIRRAFAYAIQREELAQAGQIPAETFLPPTLSEADPKNLTDLAQAKLALQEGLKKTNLGPLTLYFRSGQVDKRLAQTLQKQWKENLGVTVELQELDFKSHMEKLHTKNYQISIASWIAQIHHPTNLLDRFSDSQNAKNFSGWLKPNNLERVDEMEIAILESAAMTPLYHLRNPSLSNSQLEGLITTPCGGILFDHCKKNINIP